MPKNGQFIYESYVLGGLSPSQDGSLDGCGAVGAAASGPAPMCVVGTSPLTVTSNSSLSPLSSVSSPSTTAAAATVAAAAFQQQSHVQQQRADQQQNNIIITSTQPALVPPPPPPLPSNLLLSVAATGSKSGSEASSSSTTSSSAIRNRKKSKQKCPPKPRTIKFHEYKGPPNAQKQQQLTQSDVETSYELLLQQQQLFLQWQLEWQHKYPQIILPASQKPTGAGSSGASVNLAPAGPGTGGGVSSNGPRPGATDVAAAPAAAATTTNNNMNGFLSTASTSTGGAVAAAAAAAPASGAASSSAANHHQQQASGEVTTTPRNAVRLEEMKVSDLKCELKKRNLPVSGSKPQLLERLRNFINEDGTLNSRPVSRRGSQSHQPHSVSGLDDAAAGPMPSPPAPASNASRRVSCSSLDGSVSSFCGGRAADMLIPSLSPAGSALSMSPGPASVRPPSVINMDVDMEMNDAMLMDHEPVCKLELPPSPPPLPGLQARRRSAKGDEDMGQLVRSLQEEQRSVLEQQQRQANSEQVASTANDPKSQQRMLLQQHIQRKMQQQQQQLLQPASPSSCPVQVVQSKLATRTAHSRQLRPQLKQQQPLANRLQPAVLQAAAAAAIAAASAQRSSPPSPAASVTAADRTSVSEATKEALQSLPTFSNMFSPARSPPPLAPAAESGRPPPPDYSEAARLLQQQQQQSAPKPRVYIKSQLVDDVLDILIRNGELPPSAAHVPVTPTPTTPRVVPVNTIPFPAPSSSRGQPPPPPPLPPHSLTKPQNTSVDIKFPDIDINELGIDLESLGEAMELGVYDSMPATTTTAATASHNHAPMLSAASAAAPPPPPPHTDDDVAAMDLDVSDWLDTLLPPLGGCHSVPSSSSSSASSSTSGFSSLGSDAQQHYLSLQQPAFHMDQQQQLHHHHHQITGDPLFSSLSSDPYTDLFALEDGELKLPTGLGNSLCWDRLDFTA